GEGEAEEQGADGADGRGRDQRVAQVAQAVEVDLDRVVDGDHGDSPAGLVHDGGEGRDRRAARTGVDPRVARHPVFEGPAERLDQLGGQRVDVAGACRPLALDDDAGAAGGGGGGRGGGERGGWEGA